MTPAELRAILDRLGWSDREAAERWRTTERSIDRYKDGTRKIPGPIAELAERDGKLKAEKRRR
jgi:hypothetical protein